MTGEKIVGYDIIVQSTINKLSERINERIKEGWQPQGGFIADNGFYAQAVIKIEVPLDFKNYK